MLHQERPTVEPTTSRTAVGWGLLGRERLVVRSAPQPLGGVRGGRWWLSTGGHGGLRGRTSHVTEVAPSLSYDAHALPNRAAPAILHQPCTITSSHLSRTDSLGIWDARSEQSKPNRASWTTNSPPRKEEEKAAVLLQSLCQAQKAPWRWRWPKCWVR